MTKKIVRGMIKKISSIDHNQPNAGYEHRGRRVVVWYAGQRIELPVDAWMRGH